MGLAEGISVFVAVMLGVFVYDVLKYGAIKIKAPKKVIKSMRDLDQ